MDENSKVVRLRQPEVIDDPLTAILRAGARRLLEQVIEAEVESFLASMKDVTLPDGRERVVRHGHGPERTIQTGIGPVPVRRAKVRDRGGPRPTSGSASPRRSCPAGHGGAVSLDALLPVLYLRGVSTGDFQEALSALLGKDAPNLSPSVIGRLKEGGVGGRLRTLATARPVGPALRLHLDRWRLPASPHGAGGRMHAGDHRRHPGGPEGTGRLPGRRARERAELA
jgi:hypothetical protein